MKKITIIGQGRIAVEACRLINKQSTAEVVKVITPNQGLLWQHCQLTSTPAQLKPARMRVTARDIPSDCDLVLSLHNYAYIGADVLAEVKAVGYHPSLLPSGKGARAIQQALADGQRITGGSLFELDSGLDTGQVIVQATCFIDQSDDAHSLWAKLEQIGVKLVREFLISELSSA